MITFKQFKQKLMTDLKQRVIKNYAYDKKANDDIHYHLNFGEKNKLSKKSRDEVLIEMIIALRDEMHQGFNALNKRMNQLENKVDEGFKKINARLDQLENQAITHGWNIKRI